MDRQWALRALNFEQYLDGADMNVPTMKRNFEDVKLNEEDGRYFSGLSERLAKGAVKVLVLSESWCGDCVENLPILCKLEYLYRFMQVLIFPRDRNLDIMDQYLTEGVRVIPVFVFFDEQNREIGRFVERPKGAHAFMERTRTALSGLSPEERERGMYKARSELRREYKNSLRDETISEIKEILSGRYGL